jgi:hypothetical protein
MRTLITSTPPQRLSERIEQQRKLPPSKRTVSQTNFSVQWEGFLVFELAEGYALHDGELISMPLADIYSPLNWVTLSHEISHAYYDRVAFPDLEEKFFDRFSKRVREKRPYHLSLYETKLDDSVWELFAQWFDYRHFYDGDLEFYLWSIWRTWLQVPRVFQNKVEYWIRSVFIKVCHSWEQLDEKFRVIEKKYPDDLKRNKDERVKLLTEEYLYVSRLLAKHFPKEFSRFSLSTHDEIKAVQAGLYWYYHFAHPFTTYYVNHDIIHAINKSYPNLENHMKDTLNGRVVLEKVQNPFLLLRELLRTFFKKGGNKDLSTSSAVSLIYSLWNSALTDRKGASR